MEEYKTTDIILSACLRLEGYSLESIEINGNKGTFVFDSVDSEFIKQYDLGKVTVEPVAYSNMIKQLTTSVRRKTQRN